MGTFWAQSMPVLLFVIAACIFTVLALRPVATRLRLLDWPGGRKIHARPTPVIGGLAIALALSLSLPLLDLSASPIIFACLAVMLVCGLIDDLRGLRSGVKFIAQVAVALLLVVVAGVQLIDLGAWPSGATIALGAFGIPLSIIAVVGFVNAFNMIDGVDGLAGGVATVMLAGLALAAALAGEYAYTQIALVIAAATLGFLVFNLRTPWRASASVFLGDAGSLFLGLAIAWLAIAIATLDNRVVPPVALAWVLVLPVLDTVSLMTRRLIRGQNPFHADRNHLHHILGRAGFSAGQSAFLLIGLSAILAAIGIGGTLIGVPDVLLGLMLIVVVAAHYVFVRYAWRSTRALKRLRSWAGRTGFRQWSLADQLAILGFYAIAATVPFGMPAGLVPGVTLLVIASILNRTVLITDLRALRLSYLVLAFALWVIAAVGLRPEPQWSVALPMLALSGLAALPLGWWMARCARHALALLGVGLVAILVGWAITANWPMLEAGYLNTPSYWGNARDGGLFLVMLLMPLVGAVAASFAANRRQWRPRFAAITAIVAMAFVLMLLLGLQLQTAVGAGLFGLTMMMVLGVLMAKGSRLAWAFPFGGLATVLLAIALANGFKPANVSLNEQYLGPMQSLLLALAGEPGLAAQRDATVARRLTVWQGGFAALEKRPLAGYGRPWVGSIDQSAFNRGGVQSAYLGLGLTAGVIGIGLFAALIASLVWQINQASRTGVWPLTQAIVALGTLGSVLALMLLTPVIIQPLSALLVNVALALGVAAGVSVLWANREASRAHELVDEARSKPPLRMVAGRKRSA